MKELLKAPRTIIFIITCLLCIGLSAFILVSILRRLRMFEKDVEAYEKENDLSGEALILPARELKIQAIQSSEGNESEDR